LKSYVTQVWRNIWQLQIFSFFGNLGKDGVGGKKKKEKREMGFPRLCDWVIGLMKFLKKTKEKERDKQPSKQTNTHNPK
jgi:hypothetical protein